MIQAKQQLHVHLSLPKFVGVVAQPNILQPLADIINRSIASNL